MRHASPVFLFGILFLFIIQMAGTLVESIYISDLMSLNLDEKVLGLLFFFTPLLWLPFYGRKPRLQAGIFFGLLFLARGITPLLGTADRILTAGAATGAALSLLLLLLSAKPRRDGSVTFDRSGSAGLALALGLSVMLRAVGRGLDYSLAPQGSWVGWGLGLLLGWSLFSLVWADVPESPAASKDGIGPIAGIFLLITLAWFSFSAPHVIARWTEANSALIVITVSGLSSIWAWLMLHWPGLTRRISQRFLLAWNLLFTLSLAGTILAHRVSFPSTPESAAVVVASPGWQQQIPLALMLLLFPVIFLDMQVFFGRIERSAITPGKLIGGTLLGTFSMVLLAFANIFTNVWGYLTPISLPFRNMFWLPYLALAGGITITIWRMKVAGWAAQPEIAEIRRGAWAALLGVIFLITLIGIRPANRAQTVDSGENSLVVMTYNIQQANDGNGEKSYERQLALIRQVSPDILALQETDSARISLNNNDYVYYFAEKLGYYAYYGPSTVTGTYGVAILSKYPLSNPRTTFSYSDQDEIGTSTAEIEVNGRRFTIYCVHPDGSDTAKRVFARWLIEDSKGRPNVIALGDFNLTDDTAAYQAIAGILVNAWESVYPPNIGADGVDMRGHKRIDHIFISPELSVRNPVYVLPPISASDHPIHWAEIFWGEH